MSAAASSAQTEALRTGRPPVAAWAIVGDLVRHRSLVLALLVRQLQARYRGSILGFIWTFLNPLLLMAVYALVFRYFMRIAVPNYALFLLAGLLPWTWFGSSLAEGTNSIVGGSSLVTKSLFPTEILPTVVVLSNMVNFVLSIPLLLIASALYGIPPNPLLWLAIVPVVVLELVFTTGLVLALSALNVHYRDVQHVVANVLLLWFFLTPIVYSVSQVPEWLRAFFLANPLALMVESYQSIFVSGALPGLDSLVMLALYAGASFVVGARIFDGYRDTFAELV